MATVTVKVDYEKIINKLLNGEALTDVEETYLKNKVNKEREMQEKAMTYQAINNLLLRYARAHYTPSNEDIEEEVQRIKASRK